jgi:hypothetical protein
VEEMLPSIQIAALIVMMFWVMTDVMFKIIRLLFPMRPKVIEETVGYKGVTPGPGNTESNISGKEKVNPKDDFDIAAARRELGLDGVNHSSTPNPSIVIPEVVQTATPSSKTETNDNNPPVSKPTPPKPHGKARKPAPNKKAVPINESV